MPHTKAVGTATSTIATQTSALASELSMIALDVGHMSSIRPSVSRQQAVLFKDTTVALLVVDLVRTGQMVCITCTRRRWASERPVAWKGKSGGAGAAVSTNNPLWRSAQVRALIEARDIGGVVRFARQARGWRQADLGAATGYSASTISRLETGRSTPADFDKLQRISREVGMPPSVLGELLGILPAATDKLTRITRQRAEEGDAVRRRSLLAAGLTVPLGVLAALDDALASAPVPAAADAADVALYLSRARRLFDAGDLAGLVAGLPQLLAVAHARAEQTQDPADYARSAACYDLATEALNKIGRLAPSRITADRSMICARLWGRRSLRPHPPAA